MDQIIVFFYKIKSVLRYKQPTIKIKIDKKCVVVSGQIFLKYLHITLIVDLRKRSINVKMFLNKNLLISH